MKLAKIIFTVSGEPKSKLSHKTAKRGNFAISYSPKENRDREQNIIQQAVAHKPSKPLDGPIMLKAIYYMPIPKSYPKWQRAVMADFEIPHIKKPDTDNLNKMLQDALNRCGFFNDDSQVFIIFGAKYYSDEPRIEIEIKQDYGLETYKK